MSMNVQNIIIIIIELDLLIICIGQQHSTHNGNNNNINNENPSNVDKNNIHE